MAEKLFTPDEIDEMATAFKVTGDAESRKPISFSQAMRNAIARGIASSASTVMKKARKAADEQQEHIRGLTQRVDAHWQSIESAERRLSRHADHLARLETRLQKLEHDR